VPAIRAGLSFPGNTNPDITLMQTRFTARPRAILSVLVLGFVCVACSSNDFDVSGTGSGKIAGKFPGAGYSAPNFGDADPVNIKGKNPSAYKIHGVDVSWYNQTIDWPAVKASGIEFAFIKATEGKDDGDSRFKQNWAGATNAGIPRSAYHFYYFCATPEAQAQNYIRTVPKRWNSLPPVLDVEWNPKSPTCKKRPSKAKVVDVLKRYLDIVERHYGQKPIIYTTVDFHADNLADGALPGYSYWLRSVTAQPVYKYGNRPWTFWQYTGTGLAPGFQGEVDINVYNGSRSQWQKWLVAHSR